jgi:hypothetical protein
MLRLVAAEVESLQPNPWMDHTAMAMAKRGVFSLVRLSKVVFSKLATNMV